MSVIVCEVEQIPISDYSHPLMRLPNEKIYVFSPFGSQRSEHSYREKIEVARGDERQIIHINNVPWSTIHSICALLNILPFSGHVETKEERERGISVYCKVENVMFEKDLVHIVKGKMITLPLEEPDPKTLYKKEIKIENLKVLPLRADIAGKLPLVRKDLFPGGMLVEHFVRSDLKNFLQEARANLPSVPLSKEYPTDYRTSDRFFFNDPLLAEHVWSQFTKIWSSTDNEDIKPIGFGNEGSWVPVGISPFFRFITYNSERGDHFEMHRDAGFCYSNDLRTILSIVIYLNDDFSGGETIFQCVSGEHARSQIKEKKEEMGTNSPQIPQEERKEESKEEIITSYKKAKKEIEYTIKPVTGSAVIFDHSILHRANPLTPGSGSGKKYILRCDVLFRRTTKLSEATKKEIPLDPRYHLVRHLYKECVDAAKKGDAKCSTEKFVAAQEILQFTKSVGKVVSSTSTSSTAILSELANADLYGIFSFLEPRDLCLGVAHCNSYLSTRAKNSEVWKVFCSRTWPSFSALSSQLLGGGSSAIVDYKEIFRRRHTNLSHKGKKYQAPYCCYFSPQYLYFLSDSPLRSESKSDVERIGNFCQIPELEQYESWGYLLNEKHLFIGEEMKRDCKRPEDITVLIPRALRTITPDSPPTMFSQLGEIKSRAVAKIVHHVTDPYGSGYCEGFLFSCPPGTSQEFITTITDGIKLNCLEPVQYVHPAVLALASVGKISGTVLYSDNEQTWIGVVENGLVLPHLSKNIEPHLGTKGSQNPPFSSVVGGATPEQELAVYNWQYFNKHGCYPPHPFWSEGKYDPVQLFQWKKSILEFMSQEKVPQELFIIGDNSVGMETELKGEIDIIPLPDTNGVHPILRGAKIFSSLY